MRIVLDLRRMSTMCARILVVILCFYTCGAATDNFYGKLLFGSKTPYYWLGTSNELVSDDALGNVEFNGSRYKTVYVDGNYRHGARYPSDGGTKDILDLIQFLGNSSYLPFLPTWNNTFTEEKQELLSSIGEEEMTFLGKYTGVVFKSLLENRLQYVRLITSSKSRAIESGIHFYKGMAATQNPQYPDDDPGLNINDDILRFYKECEWYSQHYDGNSTVMAAYNSFKNGPEMKAVVSAVNQRIANGTLNLSQDQVLTIQQLCIFELGLYKISDWCQFFTENDLKTIETLKDIENYLDEGYGYSSVNVAIGCPLYNDVFDSLDGAIAESHGYIASLRFSHSETLGRLYSAFGLFRDTVNVSLSQTMSDPGRKWRESKIMPFAANIVIVLGKAEDNTTIPSHVVRVYVNQKLQTLSACQGSVCPYDTVKSMVAKYLGDQCKFKEMCSVISAACSVNVCWWFAAAMVLIALINSMSTGR